MYETSKIPRKDNPRETANVFSLFSFFYSLEIFTKSKHRELEEDDVYNIVTNCRAESLGDKLENKWQKEVKSGRKSLTKTLFKIFAWEYFYYGCLNLLIKTPINIITPYSTGILVSYFESNSSTTQEKAMLCGVAIIITGIINSTYTNFYYVAMNRLGLQIEISLSSLIYRKSLKLTQRSLDKVPSGRIVTLMGQDALNAYACTFIFLHNLWTGIVDLLVILLIVYIRIGASAVVGIAFFIALVPTQVWLGVKVKQLSLKTLTLTDERLRRIQEVLTSIRLIKMYCWENYFTKVVRDLRKKEMLIMRNKVFVKVAMAAVSIFSFRVSYFLCILAYYMLGNNISAEELFFLVSCYKSVEGLLSGAIPGEIATLAQGKSSAERIEKYLLMEEVGEQSNEEQTSKQNENNQNINNPVIIQKNKESNRISTKSKNLEGDDNCFLTKQETKNSEGDQNMKDNCFLSKQEIKNSGGDNNMEDNCFLSKQEIKKLKGYRYSKGRLNLIMDQDPVLKNPNAQSEIVLENLTLNNDGIIFNNINLNLSKPSLIAITGGIGCGKSTFLKILMNEIQPDSGNILIEGEISYASQEPWLFPCTIRQNILFGNPFDPERYYQVLKSCALIKDLQTLPEQDLTVVSDKGVNLSGGQKARINLARAIYRKADIYLLDDILSSLDLSVSKHVFKYCIKGFLKNSLCLFVCQNENYLNAADKIITINADCVRVTSTSGHVVNENGLKEEDFKGSDENDDNRDDECGKLLEENMPFVKLYKEYKVPGKVLWKDYKKCIELAGGWIIVTTVVGICFATQCIGMVFDYYANKWVEVQAKVINTTYTSNNATLNTTDDLADLALERRTVLIYYATILIIWIAFIIIQHFAFVAMTVRASRNMHWYVFEKIMGATMHFFDTNFAGSIVNRLSKDMAHVDEYVGYIFFETVATTFELIVTLSLICYINPILCVPAFGLFLVVLYMAIRFLRSSRSLRRIEPIARAPCIGYMNTSLEGILTIRATGNEKVLIGQFDRHQDFYSSVVYMMFMSKHAFALWLDLLGHLFQTCIIFSFLVFHDKIENIAGDVGVAVTQAIGISSMLKGCFVQWAETENSMTASERVLEYGEALQEDSGGETPRNWPENNKIEYKNICLKYPNSDSKILNNINFEVGPKEKIGIIGRTGAGKSSLISILFRLYQPDGVITISDLDSKQLNLKALRSKISIIPQDPVLFKGTIRSNLDPENIYPDQHLWNSLEKVGLKKIIKKFGLSNEVTEGGLNFSIGQRQLFSLARVVLSNNKIVVFDEATAKLDEETEAVTRDLIRDLFADCTLLIIAHRMGTVAGCDKILVVDGGEVVEFDEPEMLLKNKDSYFNSIIK